MPAAHAQPRRLIVLGSTGSIGVNTLAVVEHLNRTGAADIEIVGLAACRSVEELVAQAKHHNVKHVAIHDAGHRAKLQRELPGVTVFAGPDAPRKLVEEVEATDLAAAIVGAAGLPATLTAVRRGLRISLANKETLVAAGSLVMPLVREHNALLLPVDSEHSAIFQCLAGRSGIGFRDSGLGEDKAAEPDTRYPIPDTHCIKRLVLTASGGPFRTASKEAIENATVEQALNHPTWNMGRKITIDSATMMNKALELIEAHWLFGVGSEKLQVIVHPQSVVHSFVEFADHSVLAQIGPPDMRTPIQYALTYPVRAAGCGEPMDWQALSRLTFEPADPERFPALRLAYRVIDQISRGNTSGGAVLNAANEEAVAAFLERRIRFGRIAELAERALDAIDAHPVATLDDVLAADAEGRRFVNEALTDALV